MMQSKESLVLLVRKKQWIFEGDFKGCFDNLNHDYILEQINGFPAFNVIEKWLKAGFVDNKCISCIQKMEPLKGELSHLF